MLPKKPTFDQLSYAQDLVQRLRDAHNIAAERYAKRVAACDDRTECSRLITDMKALVRDAEDDPL